MHAIKRRVAVSGDTNVLPDPVTKTFGRVKITASRTQDGGYAINAFSGPHREANLCFTFTDRDTYKRVYRVIAEGGMDWHHPDRINATLTVALTDDLAALRRRRDAESQRLAQQVEYLLDRLVTPAQQIAEEAMLDQIAANIARTAEPQPAKKLSAFGELRAAHAAGMNRARANRTAVAA